MKSPTVALLKKLELLNVQPVHDGMVALLGYHSVQLYIGLRKRDDNTCHIDMDLLVGSELIEVTREVRFNVIEAHGHHISALMEKVIPTNVRIHPTRNTSRSRLH